MLTSCAAGAGAVPLITTLSRPVIVTLGADGSEPPRRVNTEFLDDAPDDGSTLNGNGF